MLCTYLLSASFIAIAFGWMVAAKDCETLDGKWYNQLGSEVFLQHGRNGRVWGEYRTAAERFNGSAGANHSALLGRYIRSITIFINSVFLTRIE